MHFGELDIQDVPALRADGLCRDAIDFFVGNPKLRLIAAVDAAGRPAGALTRSKIISKAAGQFGRALYDARPLAEFLDPPRFVVGTDQKVADIANELAATDLTNAPDGYILVDHLGRYAGIVDGLSVLRALLKLNMALVNELNSEVAVRGAAEKEARRLADTDALTGLNNRRLFIEEADRLVQHGSHAWLIYVDLDRFKYLNDRYGHAVGDDALKVVAGRIHEWRNDALIARLGGDEFGILVDATGIAVGLEEELLRLHASLCAPFLSKPGAVSVGASIGAAEFPGDAATRPEWLHAADKAMQRAKSDHGGVRLFDPTLDIAQARHARLKESLPAAVSQNQIRPMFQPFYSVASGQLAGYEVLARWNGPDVGFIPGPDEFIPLLERLGLIDEMFWGIAEQALLACRHMPPHQKVALNVSPIQFANRLFPARLAALASRIGVQCSQLEIEITETAMFRDMTHTVSVLRDLSDMGMSIALDDFGTGYSSLTLVKELPLTKLKIDKSFIQSAQHSPSSEKIVSAAIGLSQALNILCCAEGVEDVATLERLRGMNCDLVQGFLLGRPAPNLVENPGEAFSLAG
ncbi:EAL domain-containing protein [Hyphomonas sp.]|uniref:putative bifunctional diguanylate cyclase/phosphodiesterase n=1 Tax=Hyphomonas sp. TaxID=87 RepID=UPI001BCEB0B8|nr:EAL domain-containing protein [Hyphomonas sp.]